MKNTALTHLHEKAGAHMVEYAGYSMPVEYTGVISEHNAVRNNAGIFDASHMGEFLVKGNGAIELLQYVTTNDVSRLIPGTAQYSCLPNGKGGIVDDLIIYKQEIDSYMLVVNASNMQKDWEWINHQNTFGAELENISDHMSLIALQGPKSIDILQPLVSFPLKDIKSFSFKHAMVGDIDNVIISATGYTGAGGFELYCPNQVAPELWNLLIKNGKDHGLKLAGLAARDTLRLEMGYPLYGNDIDETTSPIEAGLSWIVKKDTKDFVDKDILKKQLSEGVTRRLVGFELLERGIPRKDYILQNKDGLNIGVVTSGTMSPFLQKGIGMGYVKTEEAIENNVIYIQIRNKLLKAKIVKPPFIRS